MKIRWLVVGVYDLARILGGAVLFADLGMVQVRVGAGPDLRGGFGAEGLHQFGEGFLVAGVDQAAFGGEGVT